MTAAQERAFRKWATLHGAPGATDGGSMIVNGIMGDRQYDDTLEDVCRDVAEWAVMGDE